MPAIPAFDSVGNLPSSIDGIGSPTDCILPVTFADIEERFVKQFTSSKMRPKIWDGWMRHNREFAALGVDFLTLVDGSFVTAKTDPGDVDLCYVYNAQHANAADSTARAELRRLVGNHDACKVGYLCDVYPIPYYDLSSIRIASGLSLIAYWASTFGTDRKGRSKSFLSVKGGRTP